MPDKTLREAAEGGSQESNSGSTPNRDLNHDPNLHSLIKTVIKIMTKIYSLTTCC